MKNNMTIIKPVTKTIMKTKQITITLDTMITNIDITTIVTVAI